MKQTREKTRKKGINDNPNLYHPKTRFTDKLIEKVCRIVIDLNVICGTLADELSVLKNAIYIKCNVIDEMQLIF
jgi:hypothetical protein